MTESSDLDLALRFADLADAATLRWWSPEGVNATAKADGSPVTVADVAAEEAIRAAVHDTCPNDGFLGEELGETPGSGQRRWIVDGIDGTKYFAAGHRTWGTLIALEHNGDIVAAVASSPAQNRRWWATSGGGAFASTLDGHSKRAIHVSTNAQLAAERVATLPSVDRLDERQQHAVSQLLADRPSDVAWSQQLRVAEGSVDACIWFCGGIWDHAAPSLIVVEAGGRFSDHCGGSRLDTRTAVYSNGIHHDAMLAALACGPPH